jgi:hypothetical protein
MLRNTTQYVCLNGLAAAALLCGAPSARDAVPDPEPDVIVYVKNDTLPRNSVMALARQTATAMFAEIGVRVAWAEEGTGNGVGTAVVLHLHVADRLQAGSDDALAYARPFDGTRAITLMWSRMQRRCQNEPRLAPALLAHVMAHEVAHVLQGAGRHSDTGVMKAQFGLSDYREMVVKHLRFTAYDATLVRLGLARLRGVTLADAGLH